MWKYIKNIYCRLKRLESSQIPKLTREEIELLENPEETPLVFNTTTSNIVEYDSVYGDWNWSNEGQVKVVFSDTPTDPNYWQFSLLSGVEHISNPPTPFVYSSITDWPENITTTDRTDSNLIYKDPTYTARWLENEINHQPHWWRIQIEYTRSDASVDEQIFVAFRNPVSGFQVGTSNSMLRGNLTSTMTFDIKTYADDFSLLSQGIGAGYQLTFESTATVDIRVISVTRESIYKDTLTSF